MDKKVFTCSDESFMVQGDDEEEIMEIAKMHFKMRHGMDISDEEARAKIQEM